MMPMVDEMNEVEVKPAGKRKLKKARICGKRLSKDEADENSEIHKRSMAEINMNFGK